MPRLGFWSDINVLFALRRFAYSDTRNGGEDIVLEARAPWGLYMGMRYDIWRCAGDQSDGYSIVEDWSARPWFNWQKEATFDIISQRTGQKVARSHSRKNNNFPMYSKFIRNKEIDVLDLNGNRIAHTYQQSQFDAGFTYRRYFVTNQKPEIVPNEVVSFLGAVWEIQGAKDSESKQSGSDSSSYSDSGSSRRRR